MLNLMIISRFFDEYEAMYVEFNFGTKKEHMNKKDI